MRPYPILLHGLLALGLAACATTPAKPGPRTANPVSGAIAQPFKDLSLVRESPADVLARAAAGPYAAEAPADCGAIASEIAQLDEALGPDVDAKDEPRSNLGQEVISEALGSAVSLPFRGVVRRVSGAARRDRAQARAVLAGMVRRGFLKGEARAAGCVRQPPPTLG